MKRIIYILLISLMTMLVPTSCNKRDINGDLDGMWQLTEWRDKDNNVKATKDDMIFYNFQLKMAKFLKQAESENFSMMNSMLEFTSGQIRIYEPAVYGGEGHDDMKQMSELAVFGVPEDGIFHVQLLTGSDMQLRTNSQDVLTFRKY